MKRAVQLAIDEANSSDEVKKAGYTFDLHAEDDMGDPKQAVNVANLLASDTKVVGVVGHFNSGCSIPASPVYNTSSLAMVSVSSNPALTAQGLPNVARVVAKDDAQGAAAGELVGGKLGIKKVAVVDDSTPYGQGLAAQFISAYKEQGGTVVAEEHINAGEVDFGALSNRIKAKGPEAIYYAGALNQGALLSKQSKEAGLKVPLIGGDMLYSAEYIKIAQPANAEGDIATSLGLPLEQQPKGKEFAAKYKAKFGEQARGLRLLRLRCGVVDHQRRREGGNTARGGHEGGAQRDARRRDRRGRLRRERRQQAAGHLGVQGDRRRSGSSCSSLSAALACASTDFTLAR